MNNDAKIYRAWKARLFSFCWQHGVDINNYSEEIIREYLTDGKTVRQAYDELLSELPDNYEPEEREF